MDKSFKSLSKRASIAFERLNQWEPLLRDVYEYFLPEREKFSGATQGQKKGEKVYNSVACESIHEGAAKLQESIAPIWREWIKYTPSKAVERLDGYEKIKSDVERALSKRKDIVFEAIHNSNFDSIFYEFALDLLIGTGTIRIDEDGDEIVFSCCNQSKLGLEEGPRGIIDTHWRKNKITARNIELEYRGFEVSDKLRKIINEQPDSEVEITEGCIYDRASRLHHGVAWVSDEDKVSWNQVYGESSPFITARHTKVTGEIRGRGPAIRMLSDVKTLNKVEEFLLKRAAIELAGMWTVKDDGIMNPYSITIGAGVAIPVGSNNSQDPSIARLEMGGSLELSMFEKSEIEGRIKRAFYNDLRDPAAPVRSATEIAIEARELAKRMGSAFGRLQTEALIPIIKAVEAILVRRGLLDEFSIQVGDKVIDASSVKFTSPLAQAQDLDDLLNIQQAVEFVAMTAGPEAIKYSYKVDKFGEYAADKIGMDPNLVNSEAEKAKAIQAGAEAAKQEMQSNVKPQ